MSDVTFSIGPARDRARPRAGRGPGRPRRRPGQPPDDTAARRWPAVVDRWPRFLDAWARLGELARDEVEAYAYFRVGYHRGLDRLRQSGWRGRATSAGATSPTGASCGPSPAWPGRPAPSARPTRPNAAPRSSPSSTPTGTAGLTDADARPAPPSRHSRRRRQHRRPQVPPRERAGPGRVLPGDPAPAGDREGRGGLGQNTRDGLDAAARRARTGGRRADQVVPDGPAPRRRHPRARRGRGPRSGRPGSGCDDAAGGSRPAPPAARPRPEGISARPCWRWAPWCGWPRSYVLQRPVRRLLHPAGYGRGDWPPEGVELDVLTSGLFTLALVASSGTMQLAVRAIARDDRARLPALAGRHPRSWPPRSSPTRPRSGRRLAFTRHPHLRLAFYVMTGFHGLHVIGGDAGHGGAPGPGRQPPVRRRRRARGGDGLATTGTSSTWCGSGCGPRCSCSDERVLVGLALRRWLVAVAALTVGARPRRWPDRSRRPPRGAGQPTSRGGRQLYQVACTTCHGAEGEGSRTGARRSSAWGRPRPTSTCPPGRMPLDRPRAQAERKRVAYSPVQIRQLVAYVASLGPGPPIPRVTASAGDLAEGNRLYANNCAPCHSSAGAGGALGHAIYAPPPRPGHARPGGRGDPDRAGRHAGVRPRDARRRGGGRHRALRRVPARTRRPRAGSAWATSGPSPRGSWPGWSGWGP